MKISVVVPTFNSGNTIKKCILSLSNQTHPPHEIIIVDGKSTDSTIKIVNNFVDVKLLIEKSTVGRARNIGADVATGEILFFCDSDCIADNRVLGYHAKTYKNRDDISGVIGSIQNASTRTIVSDFVQREILASQWFRNLNPDGTVKYFSAGTYNFSVNRDEFLKRKFREDLTSSDDTELSIRVRGEWTILFEPRAIVFHHHPTTVEGLFNQRKWYGEGFFGVVKHCRRDSFQPGSFFHSVLRFIDFPGDYLTKAISQDNRLLCKGCKIQKCKIDSPTLLRYGNSDEYLCRVVCLGFASGILKQRTGIDKQW